MPSKRAAAEWLAYEVKQGRGDESCHVVDVAKEQRERIKNDKRKERFVLNTDDPDLCAALESHKDRIFRKVKNKAMMLSFMEEAWRVALSDSELDRLMAEREGPESA